MRRLDALSVLAGGGLAALVLASPLASGASPAPTGSAPASTPAPTSGAPASPPAPPIVTTGFANQLTYTTAVLHGSVYPSNQPFTYWFQYGATAGYGAQTPPAEAPAGNKTVPLSAPIGSLSPATTYHFRLMASGPGGTVAGADATFNTTRIPLSFSAAISPVPVTFGSWATIRGQLSGTGASGHEVVLQENPFPYTMGFRNVGIPQSTGPSGEFAFMLPKLHVRAHYRVQTITRPLATSAVLSEDVTVKVVLYARRTLRHGYWLMHGTVTPAKLGARVALERLTRTHRYATVSGTLVRSAKGVRGGAWARFGRLVRVTRPGRYRALVVVPGGPQVSGHSGSIRVG